MKIKHFKAIAAAAAVLLLFTGCAQIRYPEKPAAVIAPEKDKTREPAREAVTNKYKQKKYDLIKKEYYSEYTPDSPRLIEKGDSFSFEVELITAQHYRIGIRALTTDADSSGNGAAVALSTAGETFGAYYTDNFYEYETFFMDYIYLPGGKTELTFTALRGAVKIESVSAENSKAVSGERYKTVPKLCALEPSLSAACVFDYLAACFGDRVLTGQYCTVNTDAEIEAVSDATGRKPAVRCGDLANYSYGYGGADKDENKEIELAEEWSEKGGIVFFTWSWYAPDESGRYYADKNGFSLENAVTETNVSRMGAEELSEAVETGKIPVSCALLIRDVDDMAATLARLAQKDIPVLWQPVPDGGSRLYWWGASGGENYVWLWRLLFERMTYYHGLDNLIWVWSGGGYEYYPGDGYVDIIGEIAYAPSGGVRGSEAVRFGYTEDYGSPAGTATAKKPAAVSESGGPPAVDAFARDNARWLFWSLYRGDYVIDENGAVLEEIKDGLDRFYNHELTVCLDELPDVRRFGITN
ncbi:MAG: glycoside hydrolase family 26 protein [Oscillospiraceae bacterium]|jgi:mannan endo-1,4-beta-mannosidase|nr:glycoside hydrolase family 26 protein [Oscillospiraceae bacterium]